jgi:hypothetical protein
VSGDAAIRENQKATEKEDESPTSIANVVHTVQRTVKANFYLEMATGAPKTIARAVRTKGEKARAEVAAAILSVWEVWPNWTL